MSELQRHREPGPPDLPEADSGGNGNLGELHRAGEDFLAAGDEAIQRALSGDSEAFLRANRQKGGQ